MGNGAENGFGIDIGISLRAHWPSLIELIIGRNRNTRVLLSEGRNPLPSDLCTALRKFVERDPAEIRAHPVLE